MVPEPHYEYISPSCLQLTGFSQEEGYADSFAYHKFINTPEGIEKFSKFLLDPTQPTVIEEEWKRKDGIRIWVEQVVKRNLDETGNLISFQSTVRDITGRKQAEAELKASKKKYQELSTLMRLMADNMPDMLWAKNLNFEYIFANKALCDNLLGAVDTNEPLGKNDLFFALRQRNSHPDNPQWHTFGEICVDSDSITLDEMKPMQFDEFGNVKGKFLFLDVHKAPLYDDNGELIGVVGSARDVTATKEAENQLRKLSQAVEQSPASVVITDLKGTIEYVNPKFTEKTGFTSEEAMGKNARIQNSGQQHAEVYAELWKTISSGDIWSGELYNKKKNGDLFWESVLISPIKNEKGEILHFLSVKEDITERKILEERLLHQTQLRALLMEISSGFINIPLEKVNDAIDEALCKMGLFVNADRAYTFDYDWENEVCNNTFEWCGEGVTKQIDNLQNIPFSIMSDAVEKHKKGNSVFVRDLQILPEETRHFIEAQGVVSFILVPMMNVNECSGFVGFDFVKEHGDYSHAEIQLLEVFAQLLANVKLRKKMVEQLVDAKEKAEESDRLKSAFLANMSHEIRTPMNGILGFADLLKEPGLTGTQQQEYIRIIEKSGQRMLNIINDIVDISKIEAGLAEVRMSETNINEQIEYTFTFFKPEAEAKGLKLKVNNALSNREATMITDREKLYAVLTNIVKNAIKFTEQGEIEIGYVHKENYIEFYVRDTGVGIPKNRQQAIFERFVQADIEDRMARQGAGLGLAITKAYIEMLGGNLWVESEEGIGSIFFFSLPVGVKPHEKPEISEITFIESYNEKGKKLNILIVEDDEVSEMLLENELQEYSRKFLKVRTGVDAVETIRNNPDINLILMDIRLPKMNGYEATKQIRQFNKNVIIIAQTAYGLSGDKENAIEAGCNDYIVKPIRIAELLGIIHKYI